MPQILSSIAGNIFGMKCIRNIKLLDMQFPKNIVNSFHGPKYGIGGIRKLVRVKDRPLVGTIIKPKVGLDAKRHAEVAYQSWIGGIDIVKDDENLTNQKFNRFEKRLKLTLRKRDKAEKETGERKMYMINITAETREMLRRAELAQEYGNEYAMVDIITSGWSALQTLRNQNFDLVLHAHRAGYAALSRNKRHGISMLVIAKIARLIGLDQLHIGTIVGKMDTPSQEVVSIDQEIEWNIIRKHSHVLEQDWFGFKPMFAVCSGGLHPAHIPYLVKALGKNIIMQFGGGLHGHPSGTLAGARAVRQALDAVMEGKRLRDYATTHKELREAIGKFGS